jgi:hypothetical protein
MERRGLPAFIVLLGSVFLVMVMLASSHAQTPQNPPNILSNPPNLISGPDIGFQVTDQQGGRVNGRWMVRVKGQWMPVGGAPGVVPAR